MYSKIEELPVILTAEEVQKITRLSRASVYNLFNSQGFPCLKLGCRKLVQRDDFFKWLNENKSRIMAD